jgi:hypothetical protein
MPGSGRAKVNRVKRARIIETVIAFVPFAGAAFGDLDRKAGLGRLPSHGLNIA